MNNQDEKEKEAFSLLSAAGFIKFPKKWTATFVEDLLSEDRGISVGIMYPGEHDPFGIPIIKAGDLNSNRINPIPDFRVSIKKHQEYLRTELEGGEIVMTLVGEIGLCSVVPKSMKGWNTARAVAVIRLKDPDEAKFLRLCFLSKPLKHLMDVWANTTVQPTINLKDIKKLPIPLPSKKERDAIVKIIDCIDDKIELNRRMNETLESIARAIFKSWFIDFDPIRAKAEGRQPEGMDATTAALFPSEFEMVEGQEIPKGWTYQSLGSISEEIFDYRGKTPKKLGFDWSKEGIVAISAKNIKNGRFINQEDVKFVSDELYKKWMKSDLKKGDILITSEAPCGELLYLHKNWKLCLSQRLFCVRPDINRITPGYLYYSLCSDQIQYELSSRETGTTVTGIRQSLLRTVPVLTPPLQLLMKIELIFSTILDKIYQNEDESRILSAYRDTLLPKLLSGELPITNPEQFTGVS